MAVVTQLLGNQFAVNTGNLAITPISGSLAFAQQGMTNTIQMTLSVTVKFNATQINPNGSPAVDIMPAGDYGVFNLSGTNFDNPGSIVLIEAIVGDKIQISPNIKTSGLVGKGNHGQ